MYDYDYNHFTFTEITIILGPAAVGGFPLVCTTEADTQTGGGDGGSGRVSPAKRVREN